MITRPRVSGSQGRSRRSVREGTRTGFRPSPLPPVCPARLPARCPSVRGESLPNAPYLGRSQSLRPSAGTEGSTPSLLRHSSGRNQTMRAAEIPVAHTPDGGWTVMPDPILAGCTEEITPGVPDLRGTWRAIEVESDGARAPDEHPLRTHVERIEQCADRV